MAKLSETQLRGLIELAAAQDEQIRYGQSDWVRARNLSGTKAERSASNLQSLAALGLVEGEKANAYNKQGQWRWRITEAGRAALTTTAGEDGLLTELTERLRWISEARHDENADLDTLCTYADQALALVTDKG